VPARFMRCNDDNGPKPRHVRQEGAQGEGALRLRKNLLHLHEQVGRAQRLAQRLRLLRARACSRAALMHPDNRGKRVCVGSGRRQRSQRLPAAARAEQDLVGAVGKRLPVPCEELPHDPCARRRPSVQRGGRWGARGAAVLHRRHTRERLFGGRGFLAGARTAAGRVRRHHRRIGLPPPALAHQRGRGFGRGVLRTGAGFVRVSLAGGRRRWHGRAGRAAAGLARGPPLCRAWRRRRGPRRRAPASAPGEVSTAGGCTSALRFKDRRMGFQDG